VCRLWGIRYARSAEKRVCGAAGPVVGDLRWQDHVRQELVKKKEGVRYEMNDFQGAVIVCGKCLRWQIQG
jgi:hypothetical protein